MAEKYYDAQGDRHRGEDAAGRTVWHKGEPADCPRCTPPGSTVPACEHRDTDDCPPDCCALRNGGREVNLQPAVIELYGGGPPAVAEPGLIGPAERDARKDTDTGQYYCATKDGAIVSRDSRPVFATLAEWSKLAGGIKGVAYFPTTGGRRTTPLFGSVPLMNDGGTPDIVGRVVELMEVLERQAAEHVKAVAVMNRIAEKGAEGLQDLSTLISQRIHFVELLDRAAAMLDPDAEQPATYEQRLDWMAKWREVVGR